MGSWLAVFPHRTIKSSYTCVLLFMQFFIISADSSVSPDTGDSLRLRSYSHYIQNKWLCR